MKCECPALNTSVLIQKPNDSATPVDGHVDWSLDANWKDVGKFRARVITRGGRETWRFNQVEAEVSRIVQVRSQPTTRAIEPRWRLRHRQDGVWQTWDIAAVYDVNAEKKLVEIQCTEVVT